MVLGFCGATDVFFVVWHMTEIDILTLFQYKTSS